MVHWPARDVPALSTVDVHRGHRSGRVPCGLSGSILKAIASLERKVIAEGVETAEQAKALNDLRCAFAQGYLYSRPVPPAISTRCSRPALGCPSNSGHDVAVGATGREGPMRQAGADRGGQVIAQQPARHRNQEQPPRRVHGVCHPHGRLPRCGGITIVWSV
jgi:hypothetical protein